MTADSEKKEKEEHAKVMTFGPGMHPGLVEFLKYAGINLNFCNGFQVIGNAGQPIVVVINTAVEAFSAPSGAKH